MKYTRPPAIDVSDATALAGDVLSPKTFYAGGDEIKVGTITETTDLSAVDTDLVAGNIKTGITIFSVLGSNDVQDISDADAVIAEVRDGNHFYAVTGGRKTGTLPDKTLNPANDTVQAGYYAATTLSAVDGDLVTGSIKFGVTVFGVEGHSDVRNISDADAVTGEVFLGKTFYAASGGKRTGTYEAVADYRPYCPDLTVADFQVNPATGTWSGNGPQRVNDGLTGTDTWGDLGEYADIALEAGFKFKQYRHFGSVTSDGTGRFKLQIWNVNEAQWEDWVTDIPTRTLASFSDWVVEDEVVSSKLRVLVTTGGAFDHTRVVELEVKY